MLAINSHQKHVITAQQVQWSSTERLIRFKYQTIVNKVNLYHYEIILSEK